MKCFKAENSTFLEAWLQWQQNLNPNLILCLPSGCNDLLKGNQWSRLDFSFFPSISTYSPIYQISENQWHLENSHSNLATFPSWLSSTRDMSPAGPFPSTNMSLLSTVSRIYFCSKNHRDLLCNCSSYLFPLQKFPASQDHMPLVAFHLHSSPNILHNLELM